MLNMSGTIILSIPLKPYSFIKFCYRLHPKYHSLNVFPYEEWPISNATKTKANKKRLPVKFRGAIFAARPREAQHEGMCSRRRVSAPVRTPRSFRRLSLFPSLTRVLFLPPGRLHPSSLMLTQHTAAL